ncbi:MAG: RNA polymerase sigma factor [Gammaproteobacteria bacterium]
MPAWKAHFRRLKQLLHRRGQSREDAEDLIQEAFIRLHSFLDAGNEVRQPEAFLVRTTLNLAVDAKRRERRDRLLPEPVEELALVDLGPSPEEILTAQQSLARMQETLDTKVSTRTREVFFLHRLEGFTHEEIANRMQMSVRTVEKHIARAVTAIWVERQRE